MLGRPFDKLREERERLFFSLKFAASAATTGVLTSLNAHCLSPDLHASSQFLILNGTY